MGQMAIYMKKRMNERLLKRLWDVDRQQKFYEPQNWKSNVASIERHVEERGRRTTPLLRKEG